MEVWGSSVLMKQVLLHLNRKRCGVPPPTILIQYSEFEISPHTSNFLIRVKFIQNEVYSLSIKSDEFDNVSQSWYRTFLSPQKVPLCPFQCVPNSHNHCFDVYYHRWILPGLRLHINGIMQCVFAKQNPHTHFNVWCNNNYHHN